MEDSISGDESVIGNNNINALSLLREAIYKAPIAFQFIPRDAWVNAVGVIWVTNTIFKCYKKILANLLNIRCIDGGLFNKRVNFPRHSFIYVTDDMLRQQVTESQIQDLDQHDVVLLYH